MSPGFRGRPVAAAVLLALLAGALVAPARSLAAPGGLGAGPAGVLPAKEGEACVTVIPALPGFLEAYNFDGYGERSADLCFPWEGGALRGRFTMAASFSYDVTNPIHGCQVRGRTDGAFSGNFTPRRSGDRVVGGSIEAKIDRGATTLEVEGPCLSEPDSRGNRQKNIESATANLANVTWTASIDNGVLVGQVPILDKIPMILAAVAVPPGGLEALGPLGQGPVPGLLSGLVGLIPPDALGDALDQGLASLLQPGGRPTEDAVQAAATALVNGLLAGDATPEVPAIEVLAAAAAAGTLPLGLAAALQGLLSAAGVAPGAAPPVPGAPGGPSGGATPPEFEERGIGGREAYDRVRQAAGAGRTVTVDGQVLVVAPSGWQGIPGGFDGAYTTRTVNLPDGSRVEVIDEVSIIEKRPVPVGTPEQLSGPDAAAALSGPYNPPVTAKDGNTYVPVPENLPDNVNLAAHETLTVELADGSTVEVVDPNNVVVDRVRPPDASAAAAPAPATGAPAGPADASAAATPTPGDATTAAPADGAAATVPTAAGGGAAPTQQAGPAPAPPVEPAAAPEPEPGEQQQTPQQAPPPLPEIRYPTSKQELVQMLSQPGTTVADPTTMKVMTPDGKFQFPPEPEPVQGSAPEPPKPEGSGGFMDMLGGELKEFVESGVKGLVEGQPLRVTPEGISVGPIEGKLSINPDGTIGVSSPDLPDTLQPMVQGAAEEINQAIRDAGMKVTKIETRDGRVYFTTEAR